MRLLLIEDEPKVVEFVVRGLRAEGWAVDFALDGTEGLARATEVPYDVIVLDLMLPGLTGTEVLRLLRARGVEVAVLILTARDATGDKVDHFEAGADDYLTKPFAFEELLVRIKALIRRPKTVSPQILKVDDLEIDRLAQRVRRGGRSISLTGKEYSLLVYLASNPGRILTRTMIMDHVWDESFQGLTNIVDVYVRHLRSKLDDGQQVKLIQTVRGMGYCLKAPDK
jgi:two-component system copper resistance phosphate regulon response regulator CusR